MCIRDRFNAGKAFHDKYGFQPIPTFEEYCQWVKQTNLVTNVELKSSIYYYPELEEKILTMVRKYDLVDRMLYSSFNHMSLVQIKKLDPDRYCCLLYTSRCV